MENWPTIILPHTYRPIVEESAVESVSESADYSSKSDDSNADSPKIGLWVRALTLHFRQYLVMEFSLYSKLQKQYYLSWSEPSL